MQGTTAGAITKRNGNETYATPEVILTSLSAVEEPTTTSLIAAGGTKLYRVAIGGAVTALKTGLASNLPWSFVQGPVISGQGPVYGMNGTDTPQQWNGTAASTADWTPTSGTRPNGTMCIEWANSIWVSGVPSTPHRVFWSQPGDPTIWPAANVVDLDPNDGEPITGLGLVGPYLMVGKRHKLFVIYDAATGANRLLDAQVGVAAHRSIAPSSDGTYFLSWDRGVYVTNGSHVTAISDVIQPNIDAIQFKDQAVGVFYQGHYYLSVNSGGAVNNGTLDFDATLKSWWVQSFDSSQFAIWRPSGRAPLLFSAKASSAIVDQCLVPGTYSDNDQAMPWFWKGPWQSPSFYRRRRFPTPYFRKRMRQARIDGFGDVDLYVAKNFIPADVLFKANLFAPATGSIFGGAGTFGANDGHLFGDVPPITLARVYSLGVARAFSFVFKGATSTPAQIVMYEFQMTDRKDGLA